MPVGGAWASAASCCAAPEAHALKLGAEAMQLEVGTRNIEAQWLYRHGGYRPCGPFSPYAATPISLFMTRRLTGETDDNCIC